MNIQSTDKQYIANTYARFPLTVTGGKGSLVRDDNDNIYIGDWDSNLYIYDLNLNLKNSTKIGYDSILDMFISKNSQVILWNSAIFSCNFGIE